MDFFPNLAHLISLFWNGFIFSVYGLALSVYVSDSLLKLLPHRIYAPLIASDNWSWAPMTIAIAALNGYLNGHFGVPVDIITLGNALVLAFCLWWTCTPRSHKLAKYSHKECHG